MRRVGRVAIPNDVLDRILELERRLDDLEGFAALPVVDPETGGDTYVNLIEEGPDIDIPDGRTIGRGGDTILLYDSGGDPVAEYAATDTGLDSASAAATAGDVIWLPAATISGDHTLTAGVHYIGVSRWASILTGQITLGDGTTLECCSVERTANDAETLKGIVGPNSGTAKIRDCDVTSIQSGSGDAYAVSMENNADLEIWSSYLYGSSGTGDGYGGYRSSGNMYVYVSRVNGSTYSFNE